MKEETVTSNGSSQANVVNKGNRVLKLNLDSLSEEEKSAVLERARARASQVTT